jgi:molecular chaperone DnaJ
MAKDYYAILGVSKSATQDEIKKAFRKKAHEFHPDKEKDEEKRKLNEVKFKEANEAYQVLSNAEKRKQYDQYGQTFEDAQRQGGGFGGFGGFGQGQNVNINMEDLEDLFGGVFGGGFGGNRRGSRRSRGADIQVETTVSLEDVVNGSEQKLQLHKTIKCSDCDGTGAQDKKLKACIDCKGSGQVASVQNTIFGSFQSVRTCTTCSGRGQKPETECKQCRGTGLQKDTVSINVAIPPGISDGETIRLSGQGEAGRTGAVSGDLYVTIRVSNDKRFERHGDDLYSKLIVSFSDAALGTEKAVETIDGTVMLTIPAGIQSGTILKMRGKGIPHLNRHGQGDRLVEVVVKTPHKLSRAQRKVFEELKEIE